LGKGLWSICCSANSDLTKCTSGRRIKGPSWTFCVSIAAGGTASKSSGSMRRR
jgi:hypothetical protein